VNERASSDAAQLLHTLARKLNTLTQAGSELANY
jgi:hypothetical protein